MTKMEKSLAINFIINKNTTESLFSSFKSFFYLNKHEVPPNFSDINENYVVFGIFLENFYFLSILILNTLSCTKSTTKQESLLAIIQRKLNVFQLMNLFRSCTDQNNL
jgi:hypothetical protein